MVLFSYSAGLSMLRVERWAWVPSGCSRGIFAHYFRWSRRITNLLYSLGYLGGQSPESVVIR